MKPNFFFTETLGIICEIMYALLLICAGFLIAWLAYL
jgi:hypothetical protein